MSFRFRIAQSFRWVDVDSFGVVNNAVYLSLFEHARWEYCARLGVLRDGDVAFMLGETRARYLRPGRLGMQISVGAKTTRLGTKSFAMEYEVGAADGALVLGWATLVWVGKDLASVEIPAAAREAIAAFEGISPGPTPA